MAGLLLEAGADPVLSVGDPGDRATIPEVARTGGLEELARWLNADNEERTG